MVEGGKRPDLVVVSGRRWDKYLINTHEVRLRDATKLKINASQHVSIYRYLPTYNQVPPIPVISWLAKAATEYVLYRIKPSPSLHAAIRAPP